MIYVSSLEPYSYFDDFIVKMIYTFSFIRVFSRERIMRCYYFHWYTHICFISRLNFGRERHGRGRGVPVTFFIYFFFIFHFIFIYYIRRFRASRSRATTISGRSVDAILTPPTPRARILIKRCLRARATTTDTTRVIFLFLFPSHNAHSR